MNRLGQMQNLWDKALEAKKDIPIHPLLRQHGLREGLGTLAEQAGRPWAAGAPFRHQGGSRSGWWASSGSVGSADWWSQG